MQTHAAEASPMGPTVQRAQLVKTKCGDITRLFLQISVPELFLKELDIQDLLVFSFAAAAAAKSLQSCPTLCDPIDSSPPGSPVPGILQARTLEWGAISFSNA